MTLFAVAGWRSLVARSVHTRQAAGSNPAPAIFAVTSQSEPILLASVANIRGLLVGNRPEEPKQVVNVAGVLSLLFLYNPGRTRPNEMTESFAGFVSVVARKTGTLWDRVRDAFIALLELTGE